MTAPRRTSPLMAIAGTLLILSGLVSWALFVKTSRSEPHAFAPSGTPPRYVQVEVGETYRVAVAGGVPAVIDAGVDFESLRCTAAAPGQGPGALNIALEKTGQDPTRIEPSEPINDIASFVAAQTERLHVECAGLGPVFVDNAEDSKLDSSGMWLILASLALLIGIPLVLSVLRGAGRRPSSVPADVGRVDPTAEEFL